MSSKDLINQVLTEHNKTKSELDRKNAKYLKSYKENKREEEYQAYTTGASSI